MGEQTAKHFSLYFFKLDEVGGFNYISVAISGLLNREDDNAKTRIQADLVNYC